MYLLLWKCDADNNGAYGESQLLFWLHSIAAQAPDAPVYIIATHAAGCGERQARRYEEAASRELGRAFPTLKFKFFFVDSKTGAGIPELKTSLIKCTAAMPTTKLELPRAWFELRAAVTAASSGGGIPVVSWREFARGPGTNCEDLEDAAKLWHSLGVLLWFHEQPGLCGLVVLRPQWLADAFRCVITQGGTTDEISSRQGYIARSRVADAFRTVAPGQANRPVRGLLVALMVQFELVHSFDDPDALGGVTLVFPYLLPEAPSQLLELDGSTRREVHVRLPFVPRGLMDRVLHGVLQLQSQVTEVEVEWLWKDTARIRRGRGLGASCVDLRLQSTGEGEPGSIRLVAAGTTQRSRDQLLRAVLAKTCGLLSSSFAGLLRLEDSRTDAFDLVQVFCPLGRKWVTLRQLERLRSGGRGAESPAGCRCSVAQLLAHEEIGEPVELCAPVLASETKTTLPEWVSELVQHRCSQVRNEAMRQASREVDEAREEARSARLAAAEAQHAKDEEEKKAAAERVVAAAKGEELAQAHALVVGMRTQMADTRNHMVETQEHADTMIDELARKFDTAKRDAARREAEAALGGGVRWRQQSTKYPDDVAGRLEEVFQQLRLFPDDRQNIPTTVEFIDGDKTFELDVVAMSQCRRATELCTPSDASTDEDGGPAPQRRRVLGREEPVIRDRDPHVEVPLPGCARDAIQHVSTDAMTKSNDAKAPLLAMFKRVEPTCTDADVEKVLQFFSEQAQLHMNFNPLKKVGDQSMLELYCKDRDGRYRTQFETQSSGGSHNLVARRGWERRMFGTAYDGHDTDRPKYGSLNYLAHLRGDRCAESQYGKSYLLLRPAVRARCTITSADSSNPDAQVGTLAHCAHVLRHNILCCKEDRRDTLMEVLLTLADPTQHALVDTGLKVATLRGEDDSGECVKYIEFQIHGTVEFARDVTMAVVAEVDGSADGAQGGGPSRKDLWRRFSTTFGVQAFRVAGMFGEMMVAL